LDRGKLTNVLAVERSSTQGERDYMYGNRNIVNPIVNFRNNGIVIWGQKTGQRRPTALDRVNVRRLMNAIKRVIVDATQYYVFEQNDSFTWSRWVDMVEPKLDVIKNNRGIYDYQVVMDETTVTEDDLVNYTMPGVVKIKPTRAAEFIPLTFSITANSVEFGDE
ncbi:MAG: phage tail sheath C-terminal domain-containing protein, partial [Phoenicibacter congonensis]|nr:phage tail sheath C-terminal domain-containing protein [Phoenicibacter congonensis]